MVLEICANSYASAIAAQAGGADRIELCENLNEGGTTPSFGTLQKVREDLTIRLYVLIRPRAGDFCYSDEEYAIMRKDILLCKDIGCDGVVIGLLNPDGTVDHERTRELVALAAPMGVTFHRAFDASNDGFEALETIIDCGCERILTSGMKNTALEGIEYLNLLVKRAGERITIMPGSGINEQNIKQLALKTGAQEFHTSAKLPVKSRMVYHNPDLLHMGTIEESNVEKIKAIAKELLAIRS